MLARHRTQPPAPRSLMANYTAQLGTLLGQRRARMALRAGKAEAEAASQAKSDFLANMSHELRTPLNAIIGFSEILADEDDRLDHPTRREFAGDIGTAGRHLLTLVNDILDLSKLQSSGASVHPEPVAIGGEAKSSVTMLRTRAADKNIELKLVCPDDLFEIQSDARRVRQILINLITNAIKFTPEHGEVLVVVTAVSKSAIAVQIRDTGHGMTPEELATAMKPFHQVDNVLTRKEGGTGIGLPLTKALAELLGAGFKIESEPGTGTTATLVFRSLAKPEPQRDDDSAREAAP